MNLEKCPENLSRQDKITKERTKQTMEGFVREFNGRIDTETITLVQQALEKPETISSVMMKLAQLIETTPKKDQYDLNPAEDELQFDLTQGEAYFISGDERHYRRMFLRSCYSLLENLCGQRDFDLEEVRKGFNKLIPSDFKEQKSH